MSRVPIALCWRMIVLAYEASGSGLGLLDELLAQGLECHVLAPSALLESSRTRKRKTDMADAKKILEVLRGHLLAGNDLPVVWVPDSQLRDDRTLVRMRLYLADRIGRTKTASGRCCG